MRMAWWSGVPGGRGLSHRGRRTEGGREEVGVGDHLERRACSPLVPTELIRLSLA